MLPPATSNGVRVTQSPDRPDGKRRPARELRLDTVFSARLLSRSPAREEAAWLGAARMGETWALEQFYRSYQPPVYALCFRLLSRPDDARDAVQTTFVRAFRELSRFRGDSALKTWIYRIAVNESLGLIRKRRETTPLLDEAEGSADGTSAIVERLAVRATLSRMKADHRAVLVLRFWEGLSYEETAAVLRISLPATKMRLKRAREEFRALYEDCR
jgi:RNA polymerase sigma-70 factor, ECF subfamily